MLTRENPRQLFALIAMLILGAALPAVAGELAKHVLPPGSPYFLLIDPIYLWAAAIFLIMLGLGKVGMTGLRNLAAACVLAVLVLGMAWQLDKIASAILWGGAYPSVYVRVPASYVSLALEIVDFGALLAAAGGAFLVLLKALDAVKRALSEPSETRPEEPDAAEVR